MSEIKVLIVDDQTLMREGIKTIINLEEDMNVVATAANGLEAIQKAITHQPDIVLLDIQMPVVGGVDSLIEMKKKLHNVKVLMLTTFSDDRYILDALANGADGFLLKDMNYDQLITSIREVVLHDMMMIPLSIGKRLANLLSEYNSLIETKRVVDQLKKEGVRFSEREWEIANLLAKGLSNKNIAAKLYISEGTVKNYISEIYSKLGVKDRSKAIIYLRKLQEEQ
ncbi:response regulator transcription factor [Halalkalibacter okhensis]|uniref:LuxR family transcriptional regulator n=1 Tax=Halalkalibacter okhensis TaxID=333138 RepID=A0A0B0IBA3_9BACI|nr:response regulator transcription factor [Halalkalibacter okhensis]KHF38147.1 LuxR family transcriptional regulator [Halalkalibacter okhensis]